MKFLPIVAAALFSATYAEPIPAQPEGLSTSIKQLTIVKLKGKIFAASFTAKGNDGHNVICSSIDSPQPGEFLSCDAHHQFSVNSSHITFWEDHGNGPASAELALSAATCMPKTWPENPPYQCKKEDGCEVRLRMFETLGCEFANMI